MGKRRQTRLGKFSPIVPRSSHSRPRGARPKLSCKRAFNGVVSFSNMQESRDGPVSSAPKRGTCSRSLLHRVCVIPLGQNLRVNRVRVIYRRLFSAATKPLKGMKPGKNERTCAGETPSSSAAEVFPVHAAYQQKRHKP